MAELDGMVAVVTGAARGIGRALSLGLLAEGAILVAADNAWAGAEATRRDYEASGRALIVTFDLNDAQAVAIARDRALVRIDFGRVDILVNNAALRMRALFPPAGLATVLDATDADWDAMHRVIVIGTLTVTRAFVPAMRVSGRGGSIVMIGSAGSLPLTGDDAGTWRADRVAAKNQPYDAAKAALASLGFSLAGELKPDGIAVNLVWPGGTMTTGSAEMRAARIAAGVDTGAYLRPAHVVPPVLHLARQRGPQAQTATALDAPLWNERHGFGARDAWLADDLAEAGAITAIDAASVAGFLHRPAAPDGRGLVLTHGAGGNCRAPLLSACADSFAASGVTVLRCDLAFRRKRPGGPPHPAGAAADRAGLRDAVDYLRGVVAGPVLLGGHSYGGRQASMLAAETPDIAAGLLLLSYPLHPPDRPERLRTTHFPDLWTKSAFVSGDRDPFGTLDELALALALIPVPARLLPIAGAGHDLKRGRIDWAPIVGALWVN